MEVSNGDSLCSIQATVSYEPRTSQRGITSTAPKYQQAPGLIRKYYLLSEDGGSAGGGYLWQSREDAEHFYTQEWKNFVKEKYGSEPTILYFHTPVVVDNLTTEIIQD